MVTDNDVVGSVVRFPLLSLIEQADFVEKHRIDTFQYCPIHWALRHIFINLTKAGKLSMKQR
jgi:hypothetical protein